MPRGPGDVSIGAVTVEAWFDAEGNYRYTVATTGDLNTADGLGLLELAKNAILRDHNGEVD